LVYGKEQVITKLGVLVVVTPIGHLAADHQVVQAIAETMQSSVQVVQVKAEADLLK
jgi:hypothetical protein